MADSDESNQVVQEGEPTVATPAAPMEPPAPMAADPAPVSTDLPKRRRGRGLVLNIVILILIAAVIAAAFTLVANKRVTIQDMRTLLELILGPLFVLAGAALGFYFASR
ncbi:MAG TPA: hypothetical protein VF660_11825 [Actinomycetota bacterium]|jgi:hypothetical protein